MPTDRRWSDADREPIASLVRGLSPPAEPGAIQLVMTPGEFADLVLDALTAAGWAPRCDCDGVVHDLPILRSHLRGEPGCTIARAHRTTPEPTDRTEEDHRAR